MPTKNLRERGRSRSHTQILESTCCGYYFVSSLLFRSRAFSSEFLPDWGASGEGESLIVDPPHRPHPTLCWR